jgi:hypothetical protein
MKEILPPPMKHHHPDAPHQPHPERMEMVERTTAGYTETESA